MKKVFYFFLKHFKIHFPLILIIILAFFMRASFLNQAPAGLTNDEVTLVMNAKAVALAGCDVSGVWSPLSLKPPPGFPTSELSPLIVSAAGFFHSSLFVAKLPYVLLSVLLVLNLYLIALKLFGKREAVIVGLVAAFNPWGIMFGRTAFDTSIAVSFYTLAFVFILYLKRWKILLSVIPLFIAFYCYIATKIIFIPLVVIIGYFAWIVNEKKYLKYYLILLALCALIFLGFLLNLKLTVGIGGRLSQIESPVGNYVSAGVNKERRLSIQTPLTVIFSNKTVYYFKDFSQKYVGAFSPSYQFFSGDNNMHVSLWTHGYFYYLDLIFLVLGFCYLFQKNKKYWLGFLGLILIAPFPAALLTGDTSYVLHGAILYPTFILLIGFGIAFFISLFKKRNYRFAVSLVLIFLYSVLILNFINTYLFRFPLYNSEGVNFSQRVLSNYIKFAGSQNKNVEVYSGESSAFYTDYLFYTDSYSNKNVLGVAKHFRENSFSLNNVKFIAGCPKNLNFQNNIITVVAISLKCPIKSTNSLNISQLSDAGTVFRIYGDTICSKFSLSNYASNIKFSDFNVEKLNLQEFCGKFIYKGL